MAELKLGLAPNRTSYFDQITNTYITLQKPVQIVTYDENDIPATVARLEKIVHALFASVPSLVLYEGNVPQECIDAWKQKYMKPFNTMTTRNVVVNGKTITTIPLADPLRNGIDEIGRPIEANRAFDRPEKVNAASADMAPASTEKATIVNEDELTSKEVSDEQPDLFSAQEIEEVEKKVAEEKPKEEAKTKKGSKSTKATK